MLKKPTIGIVLDEMSRRQTEEFMRFISGMSVKKDSIFIHAARGRIKEQEEAMQQFAKLAQETKQEETDWKNWTQRESLYFNAFSKGLSYERRRVSQDHCSRL